MKLKIKWLGRITNEKDLNRFRDKRTCGKIRREELHTRRHTFSDILEAGVANERGKLR